MSTSKQIKLFFVIILFFLCCSVSSCVAENLAEKANVSKPFPELMKYPPYFKERDALTWENIKQELQHRIRFITGRRPEAPYIFCHKFQRRITKAVDRAANDGKLTFTKIDNEFLFGKDEEEIGKIQSPAPNLVNHRCNYHSYGDISRGCVIYCDFHGMDFESDFYKAHQKELETSRPAIIASDIAEIIIFLPTLVMPLILIFVFRRKPKV